MKISVLYKDYSPIDGEMHLINSEYACWGEDGNYTLFYKQYDVSKTNVADLIIPTINVCWIKPIKY